MSKDQLQGPQKMPSEYVADARKWADFLVMKEYQGPGQMERAMERASQKTGINRSTFWSLRYRPPTDILVSVYERLRQAYEAECARQTRLYEAERALARRRNEVAENIIGAADLVAGKTGGKEAG